MPQGGNMHTAYKTQDTTQQSKTNLRLFLTRGDTIYTVLRSIAKSELTCHISLFCTKNDNIIDITGLVATTLGYRQNRDGYIISSYEEGENGRSIVYNLGRALYTPSPREFFLDTGDSF